MANQDPELWWSTGHGAHTHVPGMALIAARVHIDCERLRLTGERDPRPYEIVNGKPYPTRLEHHVFADFNDILEGDLVVGREPEGSGFVPSDMVTVSDDDGTWIEGIVATVLGGGFVVVELDMDTVRHEADG